MKAIIKPRPEEGLELADVPSPAPGPHDMLVRVTKTGICGTDRHIHEWDAWAAGRIKPPVVIGHEFVGIVEEVGQAVRFVKPGERVSAEGHIACGTCYCCRTGQPHICEHVRILGVDVDGCFAEYVVVPEASVWKVDDAIPDDHACLFDPFGNAMHTVMSQPVAARQVLVVGCGMIGLMAIGILRQSGVDLIIAAEPRPLKRKLAKVMGADIVLEGPDEAAVKEAADHDGVDVLLEMSGHPRAIVDGFRCVRHGGDVSLLGIPPANVSVPWAEQIIFKALTVRGVNGRRIFETWYQCESFLRRHPDMIQPVITHRLPFTQFDEAITAMQDGKACKVILDWQEAN